MKITDQAKDVLAGVLEENNAEGLLVGIQQTCCGSHPVFQMAVFDETDAPEDINSIRVLIPEQTKDAVENLIIDVVNGDLVVLSEDCGGGCCGGHGDHEGGCCSGHDDHEGGCCGHC